MKIESVTYEDKVQISVSGRIDANSSEQFQEEILKGFQKSKTVIVDFSQVSYISSMGLRAVLIGCKTASSKGGKFLIKNADDAIKEVFIVVGLEDMVNMQ